MHNMQTPEGTSWHILINCVPCPRCFGCQQPSTTIRCTNDQNQIKKDERTDVRHVNFCEHCSAHTKDKCPQCHGAICAMCRANRKTYESNTDQTTTTMHVDTAEVPLCPAEEPTFDSQFKGNFITCRILRDRYPCRKCNISFASVKKDSKDCNAGATKRSRIDENVDKFLGRCTTWEENFAPMIKMTSTIVIRCQCMRAQNGKRRIVFGKQTGHVETAG